MVGAIDKTALNKIAFAIKILDREGFFYFIHRSAALFFNYDFIFNIEKQVTDSTDIHIDFVKGAEPFTIKGPNTETHGQGKWTIARIDRKGLSLFPEKQYENISDLQAMMGLMILKKLFGAYFVNGKRV